MQFLSNSNQPSYLFEIGCRLAFHGLGMLTYRDVLTDSLDLIRRLLFAN